MSYQNRQRESLCNESKRRLIGIDDQVANQSYLRQWSAHDVHSLDQEQQEDQKDVQFEQKVSDARLPSPAKIMIENICDYDSIISDPSSHEKPQRKLSEQVSHNQ